MGLWAYPPIPFAQPSGRRPPIMAASSLGKTPRGGRLEENAQGDGRYCISNFYANLDYVTRACTRAAGVGFQRGARSV
jgi:hypothetical protein